MSWLKPIMDQCSLLVRLDATANSLSTPKLRKLLAYAEKLRDE